MKQASLAKYVYVVRRLITLALMWQVVRFCQGHIGAPGLDQYLLVINEIREPAQAESDSLAALWRYWSGVFMYYFIGIGFWAVTIVIVDLVVYAVGRILEVGFVQFWAEHNPVKPLNR